MRGGTGSIGVCGVVLLIACASADPEPAPQSGSKPSAPPPSALTADVRFDFDAGDVGAFPAGFECALTGRGAPGTWELAAGDGAPMRQRVLAQTSADATEDRYPLCLARGVAVGDVRASVQFQTRAGEVDQAGGIVVRVQDPGTYYLVRANALEGNVRFYVVRDGVRRQLASAQLRVTEKVWHKLLVEARGEAFRVEYDGSTLFTITDLTLPRAGGVGLWTKADSVTWFDDFTIQSLDG